MIRGPLNYGFTPLGHTRPSGVTLLTDLLAYYKCDEAAGANLLDAHTGGYHLTQNNSPGTNASGKINSARSFVRTSSQYFSRVSESSLVGGDRNLFFSVWVSLSSLAGADMVIFQKGTAVNATDLEYRLIWIHSLGKFRFQIAGGGVVKNVDVGPVTPAIGVFYHVMCWYDTINNLVAISLNDGTPVTDAHASGMNNTSAPFVVGATSSAPSGGVFHNGLVDEFGIWTRILTTTERTSLYNGGAGLSYSSFGG